MSQPLARRMIAGIALATALAISGCAFTSTSPDAATSRPLEQTVLAITTAVAAGEWATADRDLDALSAQVDTALAEGTLTVERAAEIRAAIDLVRDDIAAELAPPGETPEPSQTPGSDKPGSENGNGNDDDKKNDN